MSKTKELIHELKHHAPFTALATLIAIIVVILIRFVINSNISESAFELMHPLHVIVSAIVTSGIFYRYKKIYWQAGLVGILGAIIIGSISDIIFPFLGGELLSLHMHFHLPIFEEPFTILISALVGSIFGIITQTTKMPHFLHVGLSVFASLFYLLAFSQGLTLLYFLAAFIIVFIAVIIPCCVSDILVPFLFLGKKIKSCNC